MSEPSIREALAKAMEEKPDEAPAEPVAAAEPAEAPAPVEAAPEQPAKADDRPRGPDGKFAPKPKDAPAAAPVEKLAAVAAPATPIGTPAEPPAPKPEPVRAPQSLTPAEREAFTKADPLVQQAIVRRERETSVALNDAAGAKRFAGQFNELVAPYLPMIRAGSGDPLKTMQGLLQTAHVLQTAPAQQKAGIVAEIVKMYGVDIGQLDAALAGAQPQPGAAQPFDKEALLREAEERFARRFQSQAQERQQTKAQQDVASFATQHEFFEDVRETMGRLMQAELANDLESAYKQACERNPEISRILSQREASKQAATGAQATQRARAASASVKSSPTTAISAGNASSGDRRADLLAAFEAANGR